ncbi:hypothetical protein N798_09350 [Knoellia flava TL1]|uniref:Uncharacterized protein n=2 Tax=Knoellia flava TaxID=913969 RepID=A0A8H9FUY7_9MICO|nr:hypothetical protein [Knoellia flava]KGN31258.1 hypothetical protein N798_09350 [Knoellia flava TL1]GGB88433.1 hypothetical protein GCM10011314_30300 [Knoellia flava]
MNRRRSLAAAASAAALVALTAPTATAGATRTVETRDFTIPVHEQTSEACGFPVSLHVWGWFNVVTHTDGAGNVTKEIRNYLFRGELTANGVTVQGVTHGPDVTTYHDDGTATAMVLGVVNRRVPGAGTVTLASGLTINNIDREGEEVVIFHSGPEEESIAEVCSAFTA